MQAVLIFHNILRWAVLIFAVWTLVNALSGTFGKRPFSKSDNKSSLFFMISCDIQLLLGLILYFSGVWFEKAKSGMGEVMKNAHDRFFTVEHAGMMLLAWVLVHIGRSAVNRAPERNKHKKMLIFFGLALLIILASIPWPFRTEIARPMLRWFA